MNSTRYELAERRIASLISEHPERSFDPQMESISHLAAQRFAESKADPDSIRLEWADRGDTEIVGVSFGGAGTNGEVITARHLLAQSLARAIMDDIYMDIEAAVDGRVSDEAMNRIEAAIFRSLSGRNLGGSALQRRC